MSTGTMSRREITDTITTTVCQLFEVRLMFAYVDRRAGGRSFKFAINLDALDRDAYIVARDTVIDGAPLITATLASRGVDVAAIKRTGTIYELRFYVKD